MDPLVLSETNFKEMYWTMDQQLAHLTVNGAATSSGDLNGSGTISGWSEGTYGSLLEITWNGRDPFQLPDGTSRTFLEDGDEVSLSGHTADGRIALAEVRGRVVG